VPLRVAPVPVPALASPVAFDFRPVRLLLMRLPGFIVDRPGARGPRRRQTS